MMASGLLGPGAAARHGVLEATVRPRWTGCLRNRSPSRSRRVLSRANRSNGRGSCQARA